MPLPVDVVKLLTYVQDFSMRIGYFKSVVEIGVERLKNKLAIEKNEKFKYYEREETTAKTDAVN
jgi:hypothetical protein